MATSSPPPSAPNLGPVQAKYSDPSALVQFANRRFFAALGDMLRSVRARSILDAGCGEGEILGRLEGQAIFGLDFDIDRTLIAKSRVPEVALNAGDVQRLPFDDASFDLVLMLEVLEHVGDPREALAEAARVSRRYLLASVPHEPWWRIGNMLRLKYLRQFGNTPEHLHHWSAGGFKNFIADSFEVVQVKQPFLWTFVLAQK